MSDAQVDVWVDRADLGRIDMRCAAAAPADLRPGQVLLAIDRFALSANTVTYGMQGDSGGFWQLFPAPLPWGRLPVWGFADVEASRHDGIAPGERVFGFVPMSSRLVVEPGRVTARGFVDTAAHRGALFPTYNAYARMRAAQASRDEEDLYAILRPLFLTSFVLDDHLADNAFFGARTVLLSSTSSKTALGAAHLLRQRGAVQVHGLTSARHCDFALATGGFHAVHAYDDVAALRLEPPVVYIDFSGDAALRHAVHRRLGPALVHSLSVGATHWTALAEADPPPGVAPQAFFGPAQIRKRRAEWGAEEFQARHDAAATGFATAASGWLRVDRCKGLAQFEAAYRSVLQGQADPARAFIIQLVDPAYRDEPPSSPEERAALSFLNSKRMQLSKQ